MDLRSHSPYWLLKNGLMTNYPSLSSDHRTDIAIMGLASTLNIIQSHKGYIDVSSTLGKGTAFTINLPLQQEG